MKGDTCFMREGLALAAVALVAPGAGQAGESGSQVDLAVLHWAEDGRVSAVEPEIGVRKEIGDDRAISVRLVLDTLSGASHNGAAVQPYVQTFSAASSGTGGYAVPAGAVPLDPGFEDSRTAVSVSYESPLPDPLWKCSLGASVSRETDFVSQAASGTLSRDFNKRNTTVTAGLSFESDSIEPASGAPVPFAVLAAGVGGEDEGEGEGDEGEDGGAAAGAEPPAERRRVVDAMLGVTQVINRSTLMQFNVAMSQASGYMNDPYKLVTVDTLPATYVYENRPDARNKVSFYWEGKHAFDSEDIVDLGYRYMTDDWGVTSHTVDLYYRWSLPAGFYLQPHARWYTQTAADFFVTALATSQVPAAGTTTRYASGDYRLGALVDATVGAKIGRVFASGAEIYVRGENFAQTGDWAPADMRAVILEIGGSLKF